MYRWPAIGRGILSQIPCILAVMQIVAKGGTPDATLLDYALGLVRGPRVLYVPTPNMEDPASTRLVRGAARPGGTDPSALQSLAPRRPAPSGSEPRCDPGRRRQHRQRARDLARPRIRARAARGLGARR